MKLLDWEVAKGKTDFFRIVAEANCTRYDIIAANTPEGNWKIAVNGKMYEPSGWEVGPKMIDSLTFLGMAGLDAWGVVVALENVLELDMPYEAYVNMRDNLKKIALENYEQGGDIMIECWDDRDWQEFLAARMKDNDNPVQWLKMLMGNFAEQRKGIENTAF